MGSQGRRPGGRRSHPARMRARRGAAARSVSGGSERVERRAAGARTLIHKSVDWFARLRWKNGASALEAAPQRPKPSCPRPTRRGDTPCCSTMASAALAAGNAGSAVGKCVPTPCHRPRRHGWLKEVHRRGRLCKAACFRRPRAVCSYAPLARRGGLFRALPRRRREDPHPPRNAARGTQWRTYDMHRFHDADHRTRRDVRGAGEAHLGDPQAALGGGCLPALRDAMLSRYASVPSFTVKVGLAIVCSS